MNAGSDDASPQVRSAQASLSVVSQHIEPYISHVYDKYLELHDFKTRRRDLPKVRIFKFDSSINRLEAPKTVAHIRACPNAPKAVDPHNKEVLQRIGGLSDMLVGARAEAAFCCRGTVFIPTTQDSEIKSDLDSGIHPDVEPLLHGPQIAGISTNGAAIIHWDDISTQTTHKLAFPGDMITDDISSLNALISSSSPATFGTDGEDVLDESYR